MQSKLNLSHRPGDSNNVQLTETRDILDTSCCTISIIALEVSRLNYLDNCVIPYA